MRPPPLVGAAQAWGIDWPRARLAAISAARLGSDVPFFLVGGPAIAAGRGERLDAGGGHPAARRRDRLSGGRPLHRRRLRAVHAGATVARGTAQRLAAALVAGDLRARVGRDAQRPRAAGPRALRPT